MTTRKIQFISITNNMSDFDTLLQEKINWSSFKRTPNTNSDNNFFHTSIEFVNMVEGISAVISDEFACFEFVFDRIQIPSPNSETEFRPNSNAG